jgi:uncharacterized surface protein with fasciclin (FAS1) repeats
MKKVFQISKISILLLLIIAIASCSNSDSPNGGIGNGNGASQNILQIAQTKPELSRFVEAINKTGLVNELSNAGTLTVFAPTNTAFDASGISSAVINGYSPAEILILKQKLLNHVLGVSKNASELTTGYYKTLSLGDSSTTNTLSMFINSTSGVVINGGVNNSGASVSNADLLATNGTLHIVDGVILPPTIVNHVKANALFTRLLAAVTSTPADPFGDQSSILNTLNTTTSSTLFAPISSAFTTATTNPGGFLVGTTAIQKTRVLQYHLLNGNVLSTSLQDNQDVETTANQLNTQVKQTIKVLLTGTLGPRIQDKATFGINYGKLISTGIDIQCKNGVIHTVDKVFQPNL